MTTNVLYVVSTLRQSGPTNQLYYLLKHLSEEITATVLTLSPEPEDSKLPQFESLDVAYDTLGLSRVKGAVFGPPRLRSAVDRHDPDIVHSQGIRADTLSALFLTEYNRVTTIRNYAYDDYPAKYGQLQGSIMAQEHMHMLKRIDNPVGCSEAISKKVAEHGIDADTIQNGVDVERYQPASRETKRQIRRELNIPISSDIYISVGSLIPRKDPKTVIEGFRSSDVAGDSQLIFVGDGALRKECEEMISKDKPIRFEGQVNNVEKYLQASDYFVSASKSEGLPNAVMEALAVGLPVCLSNIQPHQEILQYGDIGLSFNPEDSAELGRALKEIRRYKGGDMRDIATEYLSSNRMANEYEDMYFTLSEEEQ